MDPLSISASVAALATATFQIVRFLGNMKEGGNDRLRLTTEVNSLWMVLKLLEGQLESTNSHEEAWLEGVRSLQVPNGVFDQVRDSMQRLNMRLKPQTGHRRALQTLRWPLIDKRDVEDTVSQIGRLKSSVSLVLNHASLAIGTRVNDALVSQKVKAVIDWLTPLNFLARQETIIRDRSEGTGAWFLESETFGRWRSGDDMIMWCPGIPGAGKTFLASIVFDKLRELYRGQDIAIFVLYCNYNDPETQSVQPLIASLVKQDIQARSVVDVRLGELHETHYRRETRPTLEELKDLLGNALSQYEKTFIVLDALDEMPDEKCRNDLVDCLRALKRESNLLVTSRPVPSIKQMFRPPSSRLSCDGCNKKELAMEWHCTGCSGTGYDVCQDCHDRSITCPIPGHTLKKRYSSLEIDIAAADQDLQTYIIQRIANAPSLRQCVSKKAGLQDEILEKVTTFANGMFLLARFHMDSLSTKLRPSSVLSTLKNLPTEISSTYDQAMERIQSMPSDHREIAKCFLSWVAYTDRALTVPEIEHATVTYLMLEDGEETCTIDSDDVISANDLSSMCAGLVTVEGERVLLVHYTAVNYLDNTREKWFPNAYAKLAKTCLTYLLFEDFDAGACTGETEDTEFEQRNLEFPLLSYASLWWGRFAYHADVAEIKATARDFLDRQPHIDASVQALWYTDTIDALTWNAKTGATALHLAAYFGLEQLVADLLEDALDIDSQDSLGNTAMMYAALGGHPVVVAELLQGGASVNITCHNGSNVLHKAAWEGRADVVKVLLTCADLDVNAADPSQSSRNALMLAAICGNATVVEHLLGRKDLLPNLQAGRTALMFAAMYNQAEIVSQLLKDPRVAINDQDELGSTALMSASYFGYTSVVEALLDAGADPEITDGAEDGGGTPLLRAIDSNNLPVVRLFLKRNVNRTSKDKYNRTLLHGAAINGRNTILHCSLSRLMIWTLMPKI